MQCWFHDEVLIFDNICVAFEAVLYIVLYVIIKPDVLPKNGIGAKAFYIKMPCNSIQKLRGVFNWSFNEVLDQCLQLSCCEVVGDGLKDDVLGRVFDFSLNGHCCLRLSSFGILFVFHIEVFAKIFLVTQLFAVTDTGFALL